VTENDPANYGKLQMTDILLPKDKFGVLSGDNQ